MTVDSRTLALLDHATSRSRVVVEKVAAAMKTIEAEIEREQGIYPYNGGRLSRQEVCRRAGIRSSVLDGASHRDSTRRRLRAWLDRVERDLVKGKRSVRQEVTARIGDWKEKAERYAVQTHVYHLQMVSLSHRLQEANARIRELEEQLAELSGETDKVVRLKPR